MNYVGITPFDIANGPGIRVTLWISGCTCHCKECHNPETWDFNSGKSFSKKIMDELLDYLSKPWVQGLTLTGGHPLEFKNAAIVGAIVKKVREELPDKDIWLYTGYELNLSHFFTIHKGIAKEDLHHNYIYDAIRNCDVIVDGPFINEEKDLSLRFRGSRNQRLINVKETLKQEKIVILPEKEIIHGQLTDYAI